MSINLNVTIKTSGNDTGYLDVDESGNANHVPQNPNAQTITWKLIGNANGGVFNSFSWLPGQNIPPNVFGNAVPDQHGNMTMSDNHINSSSSGTWTYKLVATINGQQYSTNAVYGPTATTTNPTIKNT